MYLYGAPNKATNFDIKDICKEVEMKKCEFYRAGSFTLEFEFNKDAIKFLRTSKKEIKGK